MMNFNLKNSSETGATSYKSNNLNRSGFYMKIKSNQRVSILKHSKNYQKSILINRIHTYTLKLTIIKNL